MSGDDKEEIDLDKLATKIADRIFAKVYEEVGKNVLNRLFWIFILILLALGMYLGVVNVGDPTKDIWGN